MNREEIIDMILRSEDFRPNINVERGLVVGTFRKPLLTPEHIETLNGTEVKWGVGFSVEIESLRIYFYV